MSLPRRAIAVLGTGLFGMGLAVGGFGTYVSLLVAREVPPGLAGLGATLFLFGQFVVVLPTDALSRVRSVRATAAGGLALGAVGTALGGVLTLPVALGGRLLLGLGMGATFLAAMKYAGLRAPAGAVARTQGLIGALFTLGLAVGIAVTPWAVDRVGPLPPGVVAAVPVGLAAAGTLALAPVETNGRQPVGAYVTAFRDPGSLALGLANAASYGLLIVASTWYTDVLAREPLLPATLVLTGFAAATFVGRTWSGYLTAVLTRRRAVEVGLVVLAAALGAVTVALASGASLLLGLGLVVTGAGFGLPFGPLFSLAFDRVGVDAGVLLVGMTVVGNAVALVYPWLVGQLLSVTAGYTAGFGVMALSVAGVVGVWRLAV